MAKRSREVEEVNVSDVLNHSPNAKIRVVVTGVSPMKKSRNCSYFDGQISDGKTRMWLFGFDGAVGVQRNCWSSKRRKNLSCCLSVKLRVHAKGVKWSVALCLRKRSLASYHTGKPPLPSFTVQHHVSTVGNHANSYLFQHVPVAL